MKEIQNIITKYILDRGKQKKYLAILLVLSMLVSLAVSLSLIRPADSMTIENSPLATSLSNRAFGPPRPATSHGYFDKIQTDIPEQADNFADHITSTVITPGEESGGNITIQGGSGDGVNVTFELAYVMDRESISINDPCIYYQLPEGISVPNEYYGQSMTVVDQAYSMTKPSGYYSISKDGLIVIQFTDDYIAYIAESDTYSGTIKFDGVIDRADTADGDQNFNIGGVTIKVEFDDTLNGITKNAAIEHDGNGNVTIRWTVEVTDYGYGLNGWTVSDTMFNEIGANNITVNPDNLGTFNADGTYTFTGATQTGDKVTFTYAKTIPASELNDLYLSGNLNLHNDANITNGNLNVPASKDVTLEQTKVYKTGSQDYKTGTYNNKVNWNITVENPYGVSLNGYTIKDDMLSSAVDGSIVLKDGDGNAVNYTQNGDGTITVNSDVKKVVLTYQTQAVVGDNYNNTAYIRYPGSSSDGPSSNANVTYEKPYTLSKEGTYDAENNRIVWTIEAKSSSSATTLNGIVLSDDAFVGLGNIEFVYAKYDWEELTYIGNSSGTSLSIGKDGTAYGTATLDSTNGKVTFADSGISGKGLQQVKFRYATEVTPDMLETDDPNKNPTVSNTVKDSTGNEDTETVELNNPYTLSKTGFYDSNTGQAVWEVTVENTTSNTSTLNGVVLTDEAFKDPSCNITLVSASREWSSDFKEISNDGTTLVIGKYQGVNSSSGWIETDVAYATMKLDKNAGTITIANAEKIYNNGVGVYKIVFRYTSSVSVEDMVSGKVQTNSISDNKGNSDSASATPSDPYTLGKNGTYDAENGVIIWTVNVKVPTGSSLSLNDIVLTDDAFEGLTAADINISSAYSKNESLSKLSSSAGNVVKIGKDSVEYGSMTIEGKTITFSDAAGKLLHDVTFTYTTTPTPEQMAAQATVTNTVSDNNGHGVTGEATLTNPYTLNKKGHSYDAESGLITWEVTVSNTSNLNTASLNGVELKDEAFKNLVGDIVIVSASYNGHNLSELSNQNNVITIGNSNYYISSINGNVQLEYGKLILDATDGSIKIEDSSNDYGIDTGLKTITFRYQTRPTEEQVTGQQTVTNSISDNKGHTGVEGSVSITHRNTFDKKFVSATGDNLVYGNNDITGRKLSWIIESLRDGGFSSESLILVDELTANNGGQHYITDEDCSKLSVKAKVKAADAYTTLTEGTHYTIVYYDASGNAIETWDDDSKAVRFEIRFTDAVDTEDYRYVTVEYRTTADISNVTAASGASAPTQATYQNNATFGDKSDNDDYTFTRYPDDYVEKVSVSVNKYWADNSGYQQQDIQVQLYQRVEDSSEWIAYGDPVTLSNNNQWSSIWNDLPKTTSDRKKAYYYKVEEITDVDGYEPSYSYGENGVTSGNITITNNVSEDCDKVALDKNGSALENNASIQLKDLTKATIDGTEYYVIGWKLTPSKSGMTLTDTIVGADLCTDSTYKPIAYYDQWNIRELYYDEWNRKEANYYIYDESTKEFTIYSASFQYVTYYTKIPVADVQFTEEILTYGVSNTVRTPSGNETTTNVVITPDSSSSGGDGTGGGGNSGNDLLTKSGSTTLVPGNLMYTILVNPDGKTLSNGGRIDITDLFNITDYTNLSPEQVAELNASLSSIQVEEVTVTYDADGNPVPSPFRKLGTSEYSYTVEYKPVETEVKEYEFTEGNGVESSSEPAWVTTDCTPGDVIKVAVGSDGKQTEGWHIQAIFYAKDSTGRLSEVNISDANANTYDSEKGQWIATITVPANAERMVVYDWYNGNIESVEATATKTTQLSTATLNVSVPDETPLLITYFYNISGTTLTAGDFVTTNNTASFNTGNASASDSADETQFVIVDSNATSSANLPPRIQKVDTNDYGVSLDAKFKLAYYDSSTGKWVFAASQETETKNNVTTYKPVWTTEQGGTISTAGDAIPDGSHDFAIGSIATSLDTSKLYKIVEVSVPGEYEGSNLTSRFNTLLADYKSAGGDYTGEYTAYLANFVTEYPNVTEVTFEQLLQMHLKGYSGGPYDNFFNTFQSTFYFAYGSGTYDTPPGFSENVMTVPISGELSLTNSKLIDISASKTWDDITLTGEQKANATVQVELYWSSVKRADGYPANLTRATAENLGLIDALENPKTITGQGEVKWENLPSGVNGKPIYYYVKETAYTIDGKTYYLNGDEYVADDSTEGAYKPIFNGNGASGSDTTISITNTKGLVLQKIWRDSSNKPLENIPLSEVPVKLWGTTSSGTKTFIGDFVLSSPNWILEIPESYDLSEYVSFEVKENLASDQLYGYTISYIYNTNGSTGTIQIINKDSTPTEIDVPVKKEWGDGAENHSGDTVIVKLYRTTERQTDNGLALAASGLAALDTYELNASNGWTYTWTKLPYKDESSNQRYYYYVVEEAVDGYTASYDRTERSSSQSIVITNYVPGSLSIEKTWADENGTAISGNHAMLPDNIELEIYQRLQGSTSTSDSDTPATTNTIKIMSMGDSITDGYINGDNGYRKYFYHELVDKIGYSIDMVGDKNTGWTPSYSFSDGSFSYDPQHEGYSGYTIISYGGRTGLLGTIQSSKTVKNNDPDIILLKIGTNDILDTYDISNIGSRLETLVDEIYSQKSDVKLLIMSPSPIDTSVVDWLDPQTTVDASIATYKTAIQNIVAKKKSDGKICEYIDINALFNSQSNYKAYLHDYCHPNENGYKLMGDYLAEVVHHYLLTGSVNVGSSGVSNAPADIDYVPDDLTADELVKTVTVQPDTNGNWKLNLTDLPAKDSEGNDYIYYIKEKSGNYSAAYQHNGQILNDSTQAIQITNTVSAEKTQITVKKFWYDGDGTGRPDALTLTLLQKSGENGTWSNYTSATPTLTKNGNEWTYNYTNLPVYDENGNLYYYRVEESVVPDGYIKISETNNDGINAESENKTITLKNVKTINLKINKLWSIDNHGVGSIKVRIHRSTNKDDAPDADIIQPDLAVVSPTGDVTITVNTTAGITVNKAGVTVTFDDNSIASATVNDKTITVSGNAIGTTVMHITDGKTTVDVNVEVTAEPTLSLEIDKSTIEAGSTATLTPSMSDGSSCSGITYTATPDGIVSINGNTVTGNAAGTVTITATLGNKTASVQLTVTLSDSFTLSASPSSTVTIGETITVSPSPTYGTFTYSSNNTSVATVDQNTGVVTGHAEGTAKIIATRNDGKTAEIEITVVEATELLIFKNGVDVTGTKFNIGQNQSIVLTTNRDISEVKSSDEWFVTCEVNDSREFTIFGRNLANHDITITVKDSTGTTKEIKLNVVAYEALTVTPTTLELTVGGSSASLTSNKSLTMDNITYDSQYVNVTVNDKTITVQPVAEGTTQITVTVGDETQTVNVTVSAAESGGNEGGETGESLVTIYSGEDFKQEIDSSKQMASVSINFGTVVGGNQWNHAGIGLRVKDQNGDKSYVWVTSYEGAFTAVQYNGNATVGCSNDVVTLSWTDSNSFNATEIVLNEMNQMSTSWTIDSITVTYIDGTIVNYPSASTAPASYSFSPMSFSLREAGEVAIMSDEGITFTNNISDEITLSASSSATAWQYIAENLPAYDEDGNEYYYWIVEEAVPGYTPSYSYSDNDNDTIDVDQCINAASPGEDPIATVKNTKQDTTSTMPSTGGTGTTWYYYVGAFFMMLSAAGLIVLKRRQASRR